MAVELAKVSLWLDAFTLGAPLNFLDHHLRCGNSLIGATSGDLEAATERTTVRPRLRAAARAIKYVLFVSKMADATAAEVADSVSRYNEARKLLSGYQIVLDLVLAEHFRAAQGQGTGHQWERPRSVRPRGVAGLAARTRARRNWSPRSRAWRNAPTFGSFTGRSSSLRSSPASSTRTRRRSCTRIASKRIGWLRCGDRQPAVRRAFPQELGEGVKDLISFIRQNPSYHDALGRKLNLYRCFVTLSLNVLNATGTYGMIIPLGIIGDLSAVAIRSRLLKESIISEILAFPQKDDPARRIFPEAKLSTCVLLLDRRRAESFRLRGYPANQISGPFCDVKVPFDTIAKFDPDSRSIPLADQKSYDVLIDIYSDKTVHPLSGVARCYQGEINLSTFKGQIGTDSKKARLIKGVEIGRYGVRATLRQGERQYFDAKGFSQSGERATHHRLRRLIMQGITGVDDKRRLSATVADPPFYCGHSCNYIVDSGPYSLEALLVLLNGSLMEWRFRLTSTNNNVNSYEIHGLPFH